MHKNILFLDDDRDFLNIFFEVITDSIADVTIECAATVKEAIVKLDRQDFNIIISDYRMPGIDGVRFFDILDEKFPKIARIILTGYSDKEHIKELKNKKIIYLQKPAKIEDLIKTIKQALNNL